LNLRELLESKRPLNISVGIGLFGFLIILASFNENVGLRNFGLFVFICGWCLAVASGLIRSLLATNNTPHEWPTRIFAIGFVLFVIGVANNFPPLGSRTGFLGEKSAEAVIDFGFAACFVAVVWGLIQHWRHK